MRVALVSCAVLCVIAATSASAGDAPTIPVAWQGVWEVTTIMRTPCEIGTPIQTTSLDTLCVGDTIEFEGGNGTVPVCTGNATDTTFEIHCTATDDFDGCPVTIVTDYQGTRNGDTYSQVATIVTTAGDPEACGFTEFCTEFTSTGTRIDADPGVCALVPTEDASWGQVKAIYR